MVDKIASLSLLCNCFSVFSIHSRLTIQIISYQNQIRQRQGNTLSANLFTLVLEGIFKISSTIRG